MTPFLIWRGTKRVICGNDVDFVENIEIDGEVIGACKKEKDEYGSQTVFYRTSDGRIVVHRVHWSRGENEMTVAHVFVFSSLNEAEEMFWPELRQAGLILGGKNETAV